VLINYLLVASIQTESINHSRHLLNSLTNISPSINLAEAYALWKQVVYKYILETGSSPVPINPLYRDMIAGKLMQAQGRRQSAVAMIAAAVRFDKLDKRVLEGLQLAQYDTFLAIKVGEEWTVVVYSVLWLMLLY
jgi:hypothetical protein